MPIADKKYKALTSENVAKAPRKSGVYALYAERTLIFLGKTAGGTATIRSMLRSHVGDEGVTPSGATFYKREPTDGPDARFKTLLEEHRKAHGKPPRANAS